jgi:hypothetical protein
MTNVGFTKLGLYQQRIHILDSRQPTLEFMHNKMGMYPLAAGNLQWQWTFTSFNKQFVPMSKNQQLARTSFFSTTRERKRVKELGKAHIQTNPNGCKGIQTVYCRRKQTHCLGPTHLFGRKAKG